jgi:penicillin-binding protein-related factor A (putative recombinase)
MLESDFNTIVTKSFNSQGGYGFKIPDERSTITGFHSKNPYDVYGLYKGKFWAWESKWMNKVQSFNFSRLEDHQIDNLIKSYEIMDGNGISIFAIGVDFGRADKRVFIWGNEELYIIKERKLSKKNILGKEFKELDNFVRITKGAVPMDDVLRLIYKD